MLYLRFHLSNIKYSNSLLFISHELVEKELIKCKFFREINNSLIKRTSLEKFKSFSGLILTGVLLASG